jgi:hypothetical protein
MWVKDFLLAELKPEQVVIIDNAAFHKFQETKKFIETAPCRVLFFPLYSPDLNPIEQVWGNIKKNVQRMLGKMKGMELADAIDSTFSGLSIYDQHL